MNTHEMGSIPYSLSLSVTFYGIEYVIESLGDEKKEV